MAEARGEAWGPFVDDMDQDPMNPPPSGPGQVVRAFGAASFEEEKQVILEKTEQYKELAQRRSSPSESGSERRATTARGLDLRLELMGEFDNRASEEVRAHRETMKSTVSVFGGWLRFCHASLQDDLEIVLCAVQREGSALEFAGPEMRACRQVVLAAVSANGFALEYASAELRADKEVVLEAVKSKHWALESASKELRADKEVVMAALRRQAEEEYSFQNVLEHASQELRADEEVVLESVKLNAIGLRLARFDLRSDKDFVLRAVRNADHDNRYQCYREAELGAAAATSWEMFEGAAESVLACPGEEAPILSLAFLSEASPSAAPKGDSAASAASAAVDPMDDLTLLLLDAQLLQHFRCEVSLLSGASFQCRLPMSMPIGPGPLGEFELWEEAAAPSSVCSATASPVSEPASKRPRQQQDEQRAPENEPAIEAVGAARTGEVSAAMRSEAGMEAEVGAEVGAGIEAGTAAGTEASGAVASGVAACQEPDEASPLVLPLTVNQFAMRLLEEWPRHFEVPVPQRVFLVVVTPTGESVRVTPWDWDRPVKDIVDLK